MGIIGPPVHPNCRCPEELVDQGIVKGYEDLEKHMPGEHIQLDHGVRGLPPLKDGYVRLFRGENNQGGALGSMFHVSRKYAANFAGANGRVFTVDVPKDVADKASYIALDARDVGFDLPYEWVDQATVVERRVEERVSKHNPSAAAIADSSFRQVRRCATDCFRSPLGRDCRQK